MGHDLKIIKMAKYKTCKRCSWMQGDLCVFEAHPGRWERVHPDDYCGQYKSRVTEIKECEHDSPGTG